ncbi:MAG: hypothetical protein KC731_01490 [Myxococcales bacterium]|nr:hypothetical protein [Myxococcales bacterium]
MKAPPRALGLLIPLVLAGLAACTGDNDGVLDAGASPDAGVPVWVVEANVPTTEDLLAVWGRAADDVYAVGVAGTMVHFDGARWSTLATGTRDDLWGVFGFAPDDLWIVGGDPFEGDPIVLHYDGHRFQSERILDHPEGAHALFKIWGVDGELHAVGQRGLVVRRREGVWETVSAGPLADQDFVSLWGTARDRIFAVGGRSEGRIARYDGERWTTTAPGTPGLNAVQILGDELLVGGVHGFLARHDPATGVTVVEAEGLVDLDVHALFATGPTSDGEGEAYAVGGSFAEPHRGVALRRVPPSL